MSLSSFWAQPRKGHIEQAKQIYGYINRFKYFDLKFCTEEPEMSRFDNKTSLFQENTQGENRDEYCDTLTSLTTFT